MSAGEQAPCLGIIEARWTPIENQTAVTSNSGEADVIEIGDPFWMIEVGVNIINRAHFDEWDTFLTRRRLADLTFTMWRSMRPNPRDPAITSDAVLSIVSIDSANSTVTVSDALSVGRKAYPGDMISYRTLNNGYWIGQVLAEATYNGSGQATLSVWPRPVTPHASVTAPRRIAALGEFRLTETPRVREGFKRWDVQFKAEQVLR